MKVKEFLKNAHALFASFAAQANSRRATIVMGNQSADLDSIISSISLSYYLTKLRSSESSLPVVVPIINSTRAVLQTKRECLYLFDTFSIDFHTDLLFIADLQALDASTPYDVMLVDHNELEESEQRLGFSSRVVALYDHHVDKGAFKNVSPRIIDTTVGSNATLIAELFMKQAEKVNIEK